MTTILARVGFCVRVVLITIALFFILIRADQEVAAIVFGGPVSAYRIVTTRIIPLSTLAVFLTQLAALVVGVHLFASWLWKEWRLGSGQLTLRPWRRRWTLATVGLALTFFLAGVCALGMIHQSAWLATDPDGIWTRPRTSVFTSVDAQ